MGNCNKCRAVSQQIHQQILTTQEKQSKTNKIEQKIVQSPIILEFPKIKGRMSVREENLFNQLQQPVIKKRCKPAFLVDNNAQQVKDNVILYERQIQANDAEEIKKTLKNHFIFSQLPDKQIDFVIKSMKPCSAKKDTYIFKQGDVAGSYYIILQGQCIIQINNQFKKKIGFGDSFGDLGIIYQAPRSASIKAIQNCQLVCIGRKQFKKVTDQINIMYQKQNKQFLKVLSFFKDLTQQQKNVIASTCLTQTYEQGKIIFNLGDDANSIYIIKKGIVLIKQNETQLQPKQFIGENCLLIQKNGVRQNTIIAKTQVQMISISRQIIVSSLGDNLRNALKKNILKKLLRQNFIYKKEKSSQWDQAIDQGIIKNFKAGQKVIQKGTFLKNEFLAILSTDLQSQSKKIPANSLIQIQTLTKKGQYTFVQDFIAINNGQLLRVKIISQKIIQKSLETVNESSDKQIANIQKKMMISDFYVIRQLRRGNFGQVYACYNAQTQKIYAIKVLERTAVQKDHLIQYIISQQQILRTSPKHPFLVKFYKLIKDTNFIYFIMDFIAGEDLFDTMTKFPTFDQKRVKFIASQIILVLQHLYSNKIIYRDLKPQNLMVGSDGYLILVDMGTAKRLKIEKRYKTKTIIGTPHYMAPQIILGKGYSFQVDLWSLGVLLYQLTCGKLPFGQLTQDPFTIYEEIMSGTLKYPRICPKATKQFIQKLLSKNPQHRMGSGFDQLKKNIFFGDLDWTQIYNKQVKPTYIPQESTTILKQQIQNAINNPSNKAYQKFLTNKTKKE